MNKQQLSPSSSIEIRRNKSTTEEFSPIYRRKSKFKPNIAMYLKQTKSEDKLTIQQTIQKIEEYFNKINHTIQNFDTSVKKRMQVHQKQLLSIMKSQIQNMLSNLRMTISNFNDMIDKKNSNKQIQELREQIQYYKANILKISSERKCLQIQNKKLKQVIATHKEEKFENSEVLKKMTKKLLKQQTKMKQIYSEKKVSHNVTQLNKQESASIFTTMIPKQRKKIFEHNSQQFQYSTIPSELLIQQNTKHAVNRILKPFGRIKFPSKKEKLTYKQSIYRILNTEQCEY